MVVRKSDPGQQSCFRSTDRIVPLQHWKNALKFSLANAGLNIVLPLLKSNANFQKDRDGAFCHRRCWVAPLACRYKMDFSGRIALELEETEEKRTLVLRPRMQRLFVIRVNAETTPRHMKSVMIRRENPFTQTRTGAYLIYQGLSSQLVFNKKCVIRWPGYQGFLQAANVILLIHGTKDGICYGLNKVLVSWVHCTFSR